MNFLGKLSISALLCASLEVSAMELNLNLASGDTVIIETVDNTTTASLIAKLPLKLSFNDYNNTEKITYLPFTLSTDGAPSSYKPNPGDVTLYAPWGNIAIFYKEFRDSSGLILLGHITDGLENLKAQHGDFTATLEVKK